MCEARVMRLIFIIDDEMSKWVMEIKIIIIIIIKGGEEKEEGEEGKCLAARETARWYWNERLWFLKKKKKKWTFVYAAQPRDPCDCSAKLQYIPGCSLLFRFHPFGKDPDNRGPLLSHCYLLSFQLHGTFTLILTEAKIKGWFVSGGLFISTQKRKRGGFSMKTNPRAHALRGAICLTATLRGSRVDI